MKNSSQNNNKYGDFISERKRARSLFNLVSIIYPVIEWNLFPAYKKTIKQLDLPTELTVLDIATGSGILAAAFAGQGHKVSGFDFSEKLLKKGKKKFPEISFKKFDLYDLHQIPSNSFDIVSAGYFLHGLSPKFRLLFLLQKFPDVGKEVFDVFVPVVATLF